MLRALDQWQSDSGCVGASRRWTPACSFMQDTADALVAHLAYYPQREWLEQNAPSVMEEYLALAQLVR
jgi:hypothetical protein